MASASGPCVVVKMEEVTQRVGINISQRRSEVMMIGREQEQLRTQNVELRGSGVYRGGGHWAMAPPFGPKFFGRPC